MENIQGCIDPIRNDIKRIEIEVNELYKTVYKGNGTPSLISQTLSLENRIDSVENNLNQKLDSIHKEMNLQLINITSVVNEKFTNLSHQITDEFEHKKIKMEGSWKIKVAIISSVCALLASFLPAVLSFFSKLPR